MDTEFTREELLSEQLLGAYYAFPTGISPASTTDNESHWFVLNNVVDDLVRLGHTDYEQFKITPTTVNYNGGCHKQVNIVTLRMNMMSILRRMCREFGTSDPAYELSRYGTANNFSVSQNASPQANASSDQTQGQNQKQNMTLSLEQELENLQRIADLNLSEEQMEQIKEPLETFKGSPTLWRNAQRLIQAGAGFSRDVAIQFIGSVLSILTMGNR